MNTTLSTAIVLPDGSRTAATSSSQLIGRLRQWVAARRTPSAQPATREELAALYQRRLLAARLLDERFRDPTVFRIV